MTTETNIAFVIWMLGWPTVCALEDYFDYLSSKNHSKTTGPATVIARLLVWVMIAGMLYKGQPK